MPPDLRLGRGCRGASRGVAEVVEPQPEHDATEERLLEIGVGEERVDELAPALLEPDTGADVVEDLEDGRQPRLERVLGEESLREPVQGGERGVVDLVERSTTARAVGLVVDPVDSAGRGGLQAGPDAVAQLSGRGLGERDRGELAELDGTRRDQCHDAVDEGRRLPGARTGLDEDAAVVVIADPRPGVRVAGDGEAHASPPSSSSSSSRYGAARVLVADPLPRGTAIHRAEPVELAPLARLPGLPLRAPVPRPLARISGEAPLRHAVDDRRDDLDEPILGPLEPHRHQRLLGCLPGEPVGRDRLRRCPPARAPPTRTRAAGADVRRQRDRPRARRTDRGRPSCSRRPPCATRRETVDAVDAAAEPDGLFAADVDHDGIGTIGAEASLESARRRQHTEHRPDQLVGGEESAGDLHDSAPRELPHDRTTGDAAALGVVAVARHDLAMRARSPVVHGVAGVAGVGASRTNSSSTACTSEPSSIALIASAVSGRGMSLSRSTRPRK